jgi:hypothetical protein
MAWRVAFLGGVYIGVSGVGSKLPLPCRVMMAYGGVLRSKKLKILDKDENF